ncbi:MAG: PhoH family protein [Ilumatobacteraceae bacterium]
MRTRCCGQRNDLRQVSIRRCQATATSSTSAGCRCASFADRRSAHETNCSSRDATLEPSTFAISGYITISWDSEGVAVTDLVRVRSVEFADGSPSLASSGPPPGSVRTRVVLDTSVLVADPGCITSFGDVDIVIPLTVIEELDGLKSRPDDVGRAARTALRAVEELRVRHGGSLAKPVPVGGVDHSGTLQIEINGVQKHLLIEHGLDPDKPDNRIIGAALGQATYAPTRMVSNDAALRIKAAHLGVSAEEHHPAGRSMSTRPMGWATLQASHEIIDRVYADGRIDAAEIDVPEHAGLDENSFAVLRSGSQSALVRRRHDEFRSLSHTSPEAWGLRPRSKEQRFALELLLDPDVSVVALDGRAGTGKTLVAIAAGLEHVVERRAYERLAIYRPLVPVGRADVGFLPGGLDEKLDPWMSAIHDSIVALTDGRNSRDAGALMDELTGRGQLSLESVTFLRGRSLHRQFVVVDEAQNLEPTTLKTILTRIGDGTKVVFTGDTSQIDAPYMGESNNALAVLIQAFAGQSCFGHITLSACERSEVASLAAELL